MATRTICFPISGYPYCKEQPVTFTWIKGSKRQNIRAVHDAVHTTDPMFPFWKSALRPLSRRVRLFLLCVFCCV